MPVDVTDDDTAAVPEDVTDDDTAPEEEEEAVPEESAVTDVEVDDVSTVTATVGLKVGVTVGLKVGVTVGLKLGTSDDLVLLSPFPAFPALLGSELGVELGTEPLGVELGAVETVGAAVLLDLRRRPRPPRSWFCARWRRLQSSNS